MAKKKNVSGSKLCDLSVEVIGLAQLIPYASNARTHSELQINQIAASIEEFGFNNPVLIDPDNGIIAGHGRVLAAQILNLDEIPCIRLGHLSEVQKKAYVLADNKLTLNGDWNLELLKAELNRLDEEAFDLGLTGFDDKELEEILKEAVDLSGGGDSGGGVEKAVQLIPPKEYVMIVCDDDEGIEFDRLKEIFGLKPVRRGGYKLGSPFDDIGTERVVRASQLISMFEGLENADCDSE